MNLVEALWSELEAAGQLGGALRVDDVHPCDLYAVLDVHSRPGIVLVADDVPPSPPQLEAVDVTASTRQDGRHSLGFWLRNESLRTPFALLCQDLVDETRGTAPERAAGLMLARLAGWRRLLRGERAMSLAELRGVVGELVVLRDCLLIWTPTEVIEGWLGPLDAPQDFVLPSVRIEVKSIQPDARTIAVSSADQLDAAERIILGVVTLTTLLPDDVGLTVGALAIEIVDRLKESRALSAEAAFTSRLAAAGVGDTSLHEGISFRIDGLQYFDVAPGFPAVRRQALPQGVADIRYDIELSACLPFATSLVRQ